MGLFIKLEVDESRCTPDRGAKLVELCPVQVFAWVDGRIAIDAENEDECTLCGLCLAVYPEGAVNVRRLYRD
jgi:NAD-dependent dihydropyrimidine dehydrogenase PreA subunit